MRERIVRVAGMCLLIICGVFFCFPLVWTVNTSLKDIWEVYAQPPTFPPAKVVYEGWKWVIVGPAKIRLGNSLIVAGVSTFLSISLGTMAGYAFARFPKQVGGDKIAFWLLTTRMFPPIVLIIPFYFFYQVLGLLDTYYGLIIAYLTFNLPIAIWLMRGFFRYVPKAYEEIAYLEGYSVFRTFWKVTLRLVLPGLAATSALCWIFAWNEFLFALTLSGRNVRLTPPFFPVIAVGHKILWNRSSALSIVTMMIPLALIIIFRKYLVTGFTLGIMRIEEE